MDIISILQITGASLLVITGIYGIYQYMKQNREYKMYKQKVPAFFNSLSLKEGGNFQLTCGEKAGSQVLYSNVIAHLLRNLKFIIKRSRTICAMTGLNIHSLATLGRELERGGTQPFHPSHWVLHKLWMSLRGERAAPYILPPLGEGWGEGNQKLKRVRGLEDKLFTVNSLPFSF